MSSYPLTMTGPEMLELMNKLHDWDDGIHIPEMINDIRNNNWKLINEYPLSGLGGEDPYNRIIDTNDIDQADLSEPIVIAPNKRSVIDGNHRLEKAREMGKTHLPAYFPVQAQQSSVIESNQYKFIDELNESRLYRRTRNFKSFDFKDIKDLIYLYTITLYMMSQTDSYKNFARQYAKDTIKFNNFRQARSNNNDLYMLVHALKHSKNSIKDSSNMKDRILFNDRMFMDFMRKLSRGAMGLDDFARTYFVRLENQLIVDSSYKAVRRIVQDFNKVKYRQKQLAVTRLLHAVRARGLGGEIYTPLMTLAKQKKFIIPGADETELTNPEKRSTFKKLAAAGVAGYAAAKVLPKVTKGRIKPKTAGSLAAIGTYWALGRNKK
jgi:hypothetical protein